MCEQLENPSTNDGHLRQIIEIAVMNNYIR